MFKFVKNIRIPSIRQLLSVFLMTLMFFGVPVLGYSQAHAASGSIDEALDTYTVDSATVKRIQDQAEDLVGDRDVGHTGLKNIRQLGENIPETIELNARERFGDDHPNAFDAKQVIERVKDRVGEAVDRATGANN